jgi:hypothetical protein
MYLALGLLIQLLGLSTEPHRLYIEKNFPSGAYIDNPWIYFNPQVSHLLHRPREIWAILWNTHRAKAFTPAPSPTYALPLHDDLGGSSAVMKYHLFNSFRPWWLNQQYLPPSQRPVPLVTTAVFLVACAGIGLAMMVLGLCWRGDLSLQGSRVNYTPFEKHMEVSPTSVDVRTHLL